MLKRSKDNVRFINESDCPLEAYLAAKRAHILGVLRDLHLLDGLAERRAITGAILAHHADLLRAFRLKLGVKLSG